MNNNIPEAVIHQTQRKLTTWSTIWSYRQYQVIACSFMLITCWIRWMFNFHQFSWWYCY
jgi:hypothetical protein